MSQDSPPVQKPKESTPEEVIEVGEKTLVGDDFEQARKLAEEMPFGPLDVAEASVKIVSGGTMTPFKLKQDQISTSFGNGREECDVFINDARISNKQLVIIQYGNEFVLADCGVKDMVTFDGLPVRQIICPPGVRCIVHMGNTSLIFKSELVRQVAAGNELPKKLHLEDNPAAKQLPAAEVSVTVAKKVFTTNRAPLLIGKHGETDIILRAEEVRPFHALICWRSDGVYALPLGSAAVISVNGQATEEAQKLQDGDQVVIGGSPLAISMTGDVEGRATAMFTNEELRFDYIRFSAIGDSLGGSFLIPAIGPAITIGRSPACHITIDDGACSHEHAQIVPSGKTCQLLDNYSSNGCYVNDERVSKTRVRAGDLVEMGRSLYVVHFD